MFTAIMAHVPWALLKDVPGSLFQGAYHPPTIANQVQKADLLVAGVACHEISGLNHVMRTAEDQLDAFSSSSSSREMDSCDGDLESSEEEPDNDCDSDGAPQGASDCAADCDSDS